VRSGKYDALILSQLKRLSSFQTIYTLSGHYPKETLLLSVALAFDQIGIFKASAVVAAPRDNFGEPRQQE